MYGVVRKLERRNHERIYKRVLAFDIVLGSSVSCCGYDVADCFWVERRRNERMKE